MKIIKKICGFGNLSNHCVCKGIFFTSLLIALRFIYISRFNISINSTSTEMFIFRIFVFYIKYLEPVIILIWLKFICEFLFKVLEG